MSQKTKPSDLIRSLVAERGMTLVDFAKQAGVSPESLSSTLRYGRMNLNTFIKFLETLNEDCNIILSNGAKHTLELKEK
jgi:predicted transcriptional regulator